MGSNWMQRVGAYRGLPTLARELGVDPTPVLLSAGLSPSALDDADARIPYAALGHLLGLIARTSGCEHVGLLAGRMWHLADLGLVGELTRNAPTVRQALHVYTAHQRLSSGGGLAVMIDRGCVVDIGYAIYHPDVTAREQIFQAVMCGTMNFLRELCGATFVPMEVLFPFARPRSMEPYKRTFKCPVTFDAELCAIRLHAHWLAQPVPGADAERLRRAEVHAAELREDRLIDQVVRALRTLLLFGSDSGDEVAQMLSMHRRTLNRRLQAAGTTFREVLDQARFDLACQLLTDSHISLDDVAAMLGYAGVSPFMRTFRRWAGTTPARWRRAATAYRAATAERVTSADRVAPAGRVAPADLAAAYALTT